MQSDNGTVRPPGRPRKVPPDTLKEQVLVAATRVFAEDGYDDASSNRIAEVSGIPRPTIHRMFGSKQGVFIAAVERALARIVEHQTTSLAATTTSLRGRESTKAAVGAFLKLVQIEPHTVRLMQIADSSGAGESRAAAAAGRRSIEKALSRFLRDTWEGGRPLTGREADLSARLALAIVETGAAHVMEHPEYPIDELADYLTSFIRHGLTQKKGQAFFEE